MTNQASEDKLDEILEDVYYSGYSDGKDSESGYGRAVDADSRPVAKSAIQSLVRTEKLKLLNEVIHQSTVNLKSAKAVAGWAEIRKEQLEADDE